MRIFDKLFQSDDDDEEPNSAWPAVPGEVYSVDVLRERSDEDCRAEITYSYCANGEYYSGIFQLLLGSEDDAKDYLAPFKPGHKLRVHYRPDKPEVSALLQDDMDAEC